MGSVEMESGNGNKVFHQSVGIEMKGMFVFVFREIRKVSSKILFIQENSLSLVSPGNYMIKGGRKMNSKFARLASDVGAR
jgi:hypothetical protein